MTGPRVDTNPTPAVLNGAQWSAAQSAPASALAGDPGKATTNGLGRTLTGDEWSQAQRMTPGQLAQWKIPALAAAPRDALRNPIDAPDTGTPLAPFDIKDPTTYANPILRQVIDPMLAHPLASVATLAAPFALPPAAGIVAGLGIAGEGVYHIAQYGWQKAAELSLDPATRKLAESDPERVSGEAASVQAIMLGLAPLIHAGLRATDVSAGMMEAGVEGVKESNFAPRFSEGFGAGKKTDDFATMLESGASATPPSDLRAPKGLETTPVAAPGRGRVPPVEGLVVPETVKPGRVKPIETEPASALLQESADLNASAREYQARRVTEDTQDIAAQRTHDAEALLGLREDDAARVARESSMLIRRRPKGETPATDTPFFESPNGANLLGSMAARKGLAEDASPYPPTSRLDDAWKAGHDGVTADAAAPTPSGELPSFPEGFSMGGALTDNRIPGAAEIPPVARGSNAVAGFEPTSHGETEIPATKLRAGQTLSDDPRYESGARRPLHLVTVKGLVKELVDLEDKRVDAAWRAQYDFRPDDNFHSTEDGRSVMVADRRNGGVSRQAKALQNLEDYARIDQEVTQHLVEQRGIPDDVVNELLERERQARHDRAGAEVDGDTSFDFGDESPPVADVHDEPSGSLASVAGTGPTRTRGLSSGVVQKALENHLDLTVGDLPEYRQLSMKDQAGRAADLLANDPELAARVARGEAPAPHGLLPESVFVAVEQQAIADGDVNTLRDLATGKLTAEATTMGQRIRALAEREPDSPVAAIQDVIDTRSGGAKNAATVARAIGDEVDTINEHIAGVSVSRDRWATFVEALKC